MWSPLDPISSAWVPMESYRRGVLVCVLSAFAGCSVDIRDEVPELLLEVSLGTETEDGDPIVFEPFALTVLSSGALAVYDPRGPNPLVILDAESGEALASGGTTGRGPGEILGPAYLGALKDGSVAVLDVGNRRISRFSASAEFLGSQRLEISGYPRKSAFDPAAQQFVVEVLSGTNVAGYGHRLVRVEATTGKERPLANLPPNPPGKRPGDIQAGRPLWAMLDDRIVMISSERPEVGVVDGTGRRVAGFELPWSRRELTNAEIQVQIAAFGRIAGGLRPGPIAMTNEIFPVTDEIFALLRTALWRPAGASPTEVGEIHWHLVRLDGRELGTIPLPEGFQMLWYEDGKIWASTLDAGGVPRLNRFSLRVPIDTGSRARPLGT